MFYSFLNIEKIYYLTGRLKYGYYKFYDFTYQNKSILINKITIFIQQTIKYNFIPLIIDSDFIWRQDLFYKLELRLPFTTLYTFMIGHNALGTDNISII